jgi:hypothetical protein
MSEPHDKNRTREFAHLAGEEVVVEYLYANGKGVRRLLVDEHDSQEFARELWQDATFTNGPPLYEICIRWDPKAAAELRTMAAEAPMIPGLDV